MSKSILRLITLLIMGLVVFVGIQTVSAQRSKTAVSIPFGEQVAFPETMAVQGKYAFTSNFFDGTISRTNLRTQETIILVESGVDGATAGWGIWYDDFSGELVACSGREAGAGNIIRTIDPRSGDVLAMWVLPDIALCNSPIAVENGDIYFTDVSPNADFMMIDRSADEVSILIDEPSWENDSGFGLGGLVWDGGDNFYASGPGIIRIPVDAPENFVLQSVVDRAGNDTFFTFDGSAYLEETSSFFGAAFDFNTFQSQIVEFKPIGNETIEATVIFTDAIAATGVDADNGTVYVSDGQLIPALFNPDYVPATPFNMFAIRITRAASR